MLPVGVAPDMLIVCVLQDRLIVFVSQDMLSAVWVPATKFWENWVQ